MTTSAHSKLAGPRCPFPTYAEIQERAARVGLLVKRDQFGNYTITDGNGDRFGQDDPFGMVTREAADAWVRGFSAGKQTPAPTRQIPAPTRSERAMAFRRMMRGDRHGV